MSCIGGGDAPYGSDDDDDARAPSGREPDEAAPVDRDQVK